MAASLAVLVVVFVPLERLFPARPGQRVLREGLGVDAVFFAGQYLLWSGASLAVLAWVHAGVARLGVGGLAPGTLPTVVACLLAVLSGDVLVYWFHRACHAWEPLWRFHAVHHSAEELDFLAAHREHPIDGILTQLCQNLPAFLLGVPLGYLAGLAVLRGMWAIFVHSNVRLPLGPLRWVLGAPELHHWHHARVARTRHNFANLAPWIDVVFGTHHLPEGPERYALGLDVPWPRGYLAQLARPFRTRESGPGAAEASTQGGGFLAEGEADDVAGDRVLQDGGEGLRAGVLGGTMERGIERAHLLDHRQ
jgi:sterol desaturase/sphingolipid hydroxylase (fatty acid hydroxylase superfamily)